MSKLIQKNTYKNTFTSKNKFGRIGFMFQHIFEWQILFQFQIFVHQSMYVHQMNFFY